MTISFSGLASGLDTSSWVEALVSVKQEKVTALETELTALKTKQNTLSTTKVAFTSLRSALEKLTDAKFTGSFDIFAKNIATSSNEDVFTASATSDALRQSYDVVVNQLATCTKATSKTSASGVVDDNTKLTDIGVTSGSFLLYIDGEKAKIDIDENTTFGTLKQALQDAGVNAEVSESGILTLSAIDSSKSLNIGSTSDTTNLISLTGLEKQDDGSYVSTSSLYKANTNAKITTADAGFNTLITAGTFTIGNATFTIDENTTLTSLINDINNNSNAQAHASWDSSTGKLSITSTVEGASYINIEAGTSNFTDVMNLTETQRDENGEITSSKMYMDAQELGVNALLTINGTSVISTSNTVKDIPNMTGVTLTLNATSEDEEGVFQKSTLKVEQNTSDVIDAVNEFVEAYNNVISTIDTVTASGADLQRDTSLSSFKNTIRNYANGSNATNGGNYKLLAEIGVSTGEADSSNLSTDTNTLQLDEDTLKQALADDPESVKAILAGENGILNHIEEAVEQMLAVNTGYFDIKSDTLESDISKMSDKITTQQTKVNNYQTQLENKFAQMELTISQLQSNYSNFLSS